MKIIFHKIFLKQFQKLSQNIKIKFYNRLRIFKVDQFNFIFNNHSLHYPYNGCRSIDISGDMRALYETDNGVIVFIRIGSHSELYK